MAHPADKIINCQSPVVQDCHFGPWKVAAVKSHILNSDGPERQHFESQLDIPHVPEMIFAQNNLRLLHERGFGIQFTTLDALKKVSTKDTVVQVAGAKEWKEARADCEHVDKVIHPFDWTFTTDYCGTLVSGGDDSCLTVEITDEQIDMERLKVRDKINFYADVVLFEDELHDSGCSMLNAKIRVMPSFFFVLLRFYMRVDGVVIRVNDTRLFHAAGTDYILREYTSRESQISELKVPTAVLIDPNEIVEHLRVVSNRMEKLRFPI